MSETRQNAASRAAVTLPAAPRVFVPLIQTPSERLPPQVIRVAHQLMLDIVAERYKPGEWIREQEVASRLSCSRAPVREALRLIEIDGLIEMVPWRGARVVTLTLNEIDDLFVLVGALMGVVAGFAAANASDKDIAEFESRVEAIGSCVTRGKPIAEELALAFAAAAHLGVICGSQRAAWMFQRVGNLAFWQHQAVLSANLAWRRSQHRKWEQLATALKDHSARKADAIAQRLVNQSRLFAIAQLKAEAAALQARVGKGRGERAKADRRGGAREPA